MKSQSRHLYQRTVSGFSDHTTAPSPTAGPAVTSGGSNGRGSKRVAAEAARSSKTPEADTCNHRRRTASAKIVAVD